MLNTKPLKTVEQHNEEVRQQLDIASRPRPTGIRCSACGIGELMRGGGNFEIVLTSNPPLYPTKCNHCGETTNIL